MTVNNFQSCILVYVLERIFVDEYGLMREIKLVLFYSYITLPQISRHSMKRVYSNSILIGIGRAVDDYCLFFIFHRFHIIHVPGPLAFISHLFTANSFFVMERTYFCWPLGMRKWITRIFSLQIGIVSTYNPSRAVKAADHSQFSYQIYFLVLVDIFVISLEAVYVYVFLVQQLL